MPPAISPAGPNAAQIEHWNEVVSRNWIAFRDELDRQVGPLGTLLREQPDRRDAAAGAVRTALAPYDGPDGVLLPSATWIVTARASAA